MEGHADPPDHAPHDLTGGGFRIDDATGRNRVNNTRHADDAELLVHLHFGKIAECVLRACLLSSLNSASFSCSTRSTPPCRIASASDTVRLLFCLAEIMPSDRTTSSGCKPASREPGIFCARPR